MTIEEKKKNVLDVFNTTAEKYVEYFGDDWEFINEINGFINQVIPNGKVLDLGCGSGYISKYIANKNLNPIGIDFSEKMIEIAKRKYPDIPFLNIDIANIDEIFEENTFDGLLAIYILYFIPKEQMDNVLETLSKVLKDGAPFFMVIQIGKGETFVDESLMPEGKQKEALFVNLNTQEELLELLKKHNFVVEHLQFYPNVDPDEIPGDGRLVIQAKNQKTKMNYPGQAV